MTSDLVYKQCRGCTGRPLRRHKRCYTRSAMCVQPVPTHPNSVHRPVLTMHEEPPRGIAAGVSALLFSPERSVRTFRYSKISPDDYQYWCIQEKCMPHFSGRVRADIPIFQNLPRHLPALVYTGKRRAAFLLKGPCGYSNIPKSPQIVTSTGEDRK